MIIGNLTYDKTKDLYTGELASLTVATRKVEFQPNESTVEKAPAYRVVSQSKTGNIELGAAWKKRTDEGLDYLSVRLDDPALGHPFNCAVWASKDSTEKFILVWSRDTRKAKAKAA